MRSFISRLSYKCSQRESLRECAGSFTRSSQSASLTRNWPHSRRTCSCRCTSAIHSFPITVFSTPLSRSKSAVTASISLDHLQFVVLPLRHISSSPQNAKISYASGRNERSWSAEPSHHLYNSARQYRIDRSTNALVFPSTPFIAYVTGRV